jgi:hypothetical protein
VEDKSAAGAAAVSQKKSNKSKKKKAGDQGVSASSKAAPWATDAKETGTGAAGVGVEVRSLAELSFGGGGGQRSTAVAVGIGSGEAEDLFKSMDIECTVCIVISERFKVCKYEYTQDEAPSRLVLTRTASRLAHFTHTNGESAPLQANFEDI